ncbi:hypothetical protein N9L68_05840 [bacterium]|nr:hypothetical protein [bacterium]
MREASRLGAWLADVVYTVMLVELGFARHVVKYVAVGNDAYAELAANLGVKGDWSCSPGSAFEEMRFDWIVAVGAQLACAHGRARA